MSQGRVHRERIRGATGKSKRADLGNTARTAAEIAWLRQPAEPSQSSHSPQPELLAKIWVKFLRLSLDKGRRRAIEWIAWRGGIHCSAATSFTARSLPDSPRELREHPSRLSVVEEVEVPCHSGI